MAHCPLAAIQVSVSFLVSRHKILAICTNLDLDVISRLSRTSHQLRQTTIPELHHHVHVRNHKADAFTSALKEDSTLAEYVTTLTINYHWEYEPEDDPHFLYAEALAPTITRLTRLRTLIIKGTNFRDRYKYDIDKVRIDNLDHGTFIALHDAVIKQRKACVKFQKSFLQTHTSSVLGELNFSDRAPWDLSKRSAV
ncbi:hypothetical protein BDV12DRAFT_199425 [Aspergillus spectabilis]